MPTRSENLVPVYQRPQYCRDSLGLSKKIRGKNAHEEAIFGLAGSSILFVKV